MGGKTDDTALVFLYGLLAVAVVPVIFIAKTWRVIAACLAWVGMVEAVKHFLYWFSH